MATRKNPQPTWQILGMGPFLFDQYEGHEMSIAELERMLCGIGVRDADIRTDIGVFELWFEPGMAFTRRGQPLSFHPSRVPSEDIAEQIRGSVELRVENAWEVMRLEFEAAVQNGRFLLFGRKESALRDLEAIPPDVFRTFYVTDWINGDAVGPVGERIFSIHLVFSAEAGNAEAGDGQRAKRQSPAQKRAAHALDDLRSRGIQVDLLSRKEQHKAVADWCKERGLNAPSIDSVERAADERRSRK